MEWANGNYSMSLPESRDKFIRMLSNDGFVERSMHVLELAIALGLRADQRTDTRVEGESQKDIAKVGQFDPDGVFAEIIMDRYGSLEERVRVQRVMEHAMWGLDRIRENFEASRTLDLAGLVDAR